MASSSSQPASAPSALAFPGLEIDLSRGRLIIDAQVCLREGPLELLLCARNTKEHESILHTDVAPWQVHAGLLALGLERGKPARWQQTPGGRGGFLPPQGSGLEITLRWQDAQGVAQEVPAGRWLSTQSASGAVVPAWVFVGSEVLPDGRYLADLSGDMICISNFADAIVDVPLESSASNALLCFRANSPEIPPLATPVQVVIAPQADRAGSADARVTMDIDRLGRLSIDGRRIMPSDVPSWARSYKARHERGDVVLRVDSRALAYDIALAKSQLGLGGVDDVQEQYIPSPPPLPRTTGEADESVAWFAQQFKQAGGQISDDAQQAQSILLQTQAQIEELQALQDIWRRYARQLKTLLEQESGKRDTQPSTR